MHRIDGPDNVAGMFSAGDPTLGIPGTIVTPAWLNAVQEELVGLLTALGVALDKANNGQVAAALAPGPWVAFPASANWATVAGTAAPSYRLLADGTVQFRGRMKVLVTAGAYLDLTNMPAASKPPAGRPVTLLAPFQPAAPGTSWVLLNLSNTNCTAGTAQVNDVLILDGVQYVP